MKSSTPSYRIAQSAASPLLRHDPGQEAVPVACGRPGRRRDRHPRAATPRSKSSRTLLPQAIEGPRCRAAAPGDRQAEELWRCASDHPALRPARYEAVCQQQSRGLPSADATARATDAPLQVGRSSAAIPLGSRDHPESVSSWATPRQRSQPPYAPRSLLRRVASGDVCLLNASRAPSTGTRLADESRTGTRSGSLRMKLTS